MRHRGGFAAAPGVHRGGRVERPANRGSTGGASAVGHSADLGHPLDTGFGHRTHHGRAHSRTAGHRGRVGTGSCHSGAQDPVGARSVPDPTNSVALDRLTQLAGRVLHVPVLCVSLVDADRRLVMSSCNLSAPTSLVGNAGRRRRRPRCAPCPSWTTSLAGGAFRSSISCGRFPPGSWARWGLGLPRGVHLGGHDGRGDCTSRVVRLVSPLRPIPTARGRA
jgi:hypothetical protein